MFDRNQNILPTTKNIEQTLSNMHATRSNVVDPTIVFKNVWTCSRGLTLTCRPPFKKSRGISSQPTRKILQNPDASSYFNKAQNFIWKISPLRYTWCQISLLLNQQQKFTYQAINLLKKRRKISMYSQEVYFDNHQSTVKIPKNNSSAIIYVWNRKQQRDTQPYTLSKTRLVRSMFFAADRKLSFGDWDNNWNIWTQVSSKWMSSKWMSQKSMC